MGRKEIAMLVAAIVCILVAVSIVAMSMRKPRGFHPTVTSPALTTPSAPTSILAPLGGEKLEPIKQHEGAR